MGELNWQGKIVMAVTLTAFVIAALPFWIAGYIAYRLGWSE